MNQSLTVSIDNRLRLATAVLAVSDWPDEEQRQTPHAVHAHAKQTRHFLMPFAGHDAVYLTNQALGNGVSLEELGSAALRCDWPTFNTTEPLPQVLQIETWLAALADFAAKTNIAADLWAAHAQLWETAAAELDAIFTDSPLPVFFARLTGRPLPAAIAITPTLTYPALKPLLATRRDQLWLLLPPPKAVGESPPWPYAEDPSWVVARSCERLLLHLLANDLRGLDEKTLETAVRAAIVLCLEQAFDEFEANAYLIRSKKAYGLPDLPTTTAHLRQILAENGRFAHLFNK